MDTELLVESQLAGGQDLLEQLVRDDFEISVAFWVKTSEEGLWHLYVASASVDEGRLGEAYRKVYDSLGKIPDSTVSPSDITLLHATNPIAKDAERVRDLHATHVPFSYRGKRLGGLSITEAYIYPKPPIPGFDEIKKRFPSAELFRLTVKSSAPLLGVVSPFAGKINRNEFEGKPPGTLLLLGPKLTGGQPIAALGFVYRPEGWNNLFNPTTQKWEEVVHVGTGKPLYEAADFSPLAALKCTS